MNSNADPVLEQRKAFQPIVDVFRAAQTWSIAEAWDREQCAKALQKACEKARDDLAQLAIDAYLATLPAPAAQAKEGAQ